MARSISFVFCLLQVLSVSGCGSASQENKNTSVSKSFDGLTQEDQVIINAGQELWSFKNVEQFNISGSMTCYSEKEKKNFTISMSENCMVNVANRILSCEIPGLLFSSTLLAQWSENWITAVSFHVTPHAGDRVGLIYPMHIVKSSRKNFSSCAQSTSGIFVRSL